MYASRDSEKIRNSRSKCVMWFFASVGMIGIRWHTPNLDLIYRLIIRHEILGFASAVHQRRSLFQWLVAARSEIALSRLLLPVHGTVYHRLSRYRRNCRLWSVIWRRRPTCSQHPTCDAHSSSPIFLCAEHVDSKCNYVTCPWNLLRLNATIIIFVHNNNKIMLCSIWNR